MREFLKGLSITDWVGLSVLFAGIGIVVWLVVVIFEKESEPEPEPIRVHYVILLEHCVTRSIDTLDVGLDSEPYIEYAHVAVPVFHYGNEQLLNYCSWQIIKQDTIK